MNRLIVNRNLATILCVMLASCASREKMPDPPQLVEVKVPYKVPCVEKSDIPTDPKIHGNEDLLKLSDYDLIQAIHYDRLVLMIQNKQLNAAMIECIKPDSAP